MTSACSLLGAGDEGRGRHVAAAVGDGVAVGLQVGDDDGLADVVDVALHGAHDDGALLLALAAHQGGVADPGGGVHRLGGQHQLGQEDLAALEGVADLADAHDEALVDDLAGGHAGGQGAGGDVLGGGGVEVDDRVDRLLDELVSVGHSV